MSFVWPFAFRGDCSLQSFIQNWKPHYYTALINWVNWINNYDFVKTIHSSESCISHKWLHLSIKGVWSWIFPWRNEVCLYKHQKTALLFLCRTYSLLKILISVREIAFLPNCVEEVQKQTAKNTEGNWQQFNVTVKIKPSFCCLNTISIYFYSLLCLIFTLFVASLQRDCVIPRTSICSRWCTRLKRHKYCYQWDSFSILFVKQNKVYFVILFPPPPACFLKISHG